MNMIWSFLAGVLLGMFVMAILKATLLDTLHKIRRLHGEQVALMGNNAILLDHVRAQSADAEALVNTAQQLVSEAKNYNDMAEAHHANAKPLRVDTEILLQQVKQIDAKAN